MAAPTILINPQAKPGHISDKECFYSGVWFAYTVIRNQRGEVLAASCVRVERKLNPLCTAASMMRMALQFGQSTCFSKVTVESNFADLLNSDRLCSLEVA